MNPYDQRFADPSSYRDRRSDLRGPPPVAAAPGMRGPGPSYGRGGGPVTYGGPGPAGAYSGSGRGAGPAPNSGNFNGYPPFQPPVGRFDMGRGGGGMSNGHGGRGGGGGGGRRGRGRGGGGDGGRNYDSGRGGGGFGGNKTFNGAGGRSYGSERGESFGFAGGRGGGRGFDGGRSGGRGGRYGASSRGDLDNVALPKQDFGSLVPFEKNFYIESPSVRAMSDHEVMLYRSRREITVEGHDVPKPIRMFEEANFPGTICPVNAIGVLL